ncbi:diguanylate cyclase domain-containing protein [Viridibacterium curvum]|uniref:Diguanylate cyclase n=1 Tax=Viridibacterium curvum TaxID=1101404 RepID=A0ABP9R544_9RHOO
MTEHGTHDAAQQRPAWALSAWMRVGVLCVVLATVLPMLFFLERFAREAVERQAGEALNQVAWQMRDALDRGMWERYIEIRLLAGREAIRDGRRHPAEARAALEQLKTNVPEYAWIGLTGADGKVQAATGGLLEGADVSQRPWFAGAQQKAFVGDVHAALLLEKKLPKQAEPWRFVDVAFPVEGKNGKFQGVVGAHLSWTWAEKLNKQLIEPRGEVLKADILVLRADGEVLLGPQEMRGSKLTLESVRRAQQVDKGYRLETWPDGQRYVTSFVRTRGHGNYPGLGWIVLARRHEAVALAEYKTLQLQIGVTCATTGVLVLVFASLLARRVARPLEALSEAVMQLATHPGKGEIPELRDYREASVLSCALRDSLQAEVRLLAELEQRVDDRTSALGEANRHLGLALAERAAAELTARESEEKLRTIADNLPVMIAYLDESRCYRFNNEAYGVFFGLPVAEITGRRIASLLDEQARQRVEEHLDKVFAGEEVHFENSVMQSEMERTLACSFIPHANAEGKVVGVYVMAQDVTLRKALERQLEQRALQDELTRLPNRRALFDRLPQAMARADRWDKPVGVLFLDLDGFKKINDTMGHEMGDELLRQFAARLQAAVRQTDTVARLAGDEFTVLLESLAMGADHAQDVARKIISAMQQPFQLGSTPVVMTTSIGIALYPPRAGISPDELLARADHAMYEAKRAGKNQCRYAA